ncbi:MAG TPA: 30S ribosomal protein S20 [Candidatus Pacebacteria bacterium]|nr:MAG: 30S ribosomal protein S20 (Modular protein) [Microgenomates group bacterium GW2011_GWB1_45_17]KKU24197.1 MAG: 30S ribosomal protein S20 (Modular protein) [Microgenomates group bacterium GW2011_GWC1_46_15]KKU24913.1 MAG: 30S ribosomal protein S20 (Modular protein) [Microgenomates group bacterium GW2011_GWA1_46_15]HAV15470.1 30S ribosomal protein S20 [Candidatus Paceibacterota bacterium]HCR11420.1 30S ribosomal protein S20 [Candidatus Paceibacterota bacterium]
MPITSSALKALRQAKKHTELNRTFRTRIKSTVDAMKKTPTAELLTEAFSALDRAVKKNILHKNKAARLKSSLSKLMKSAESSVVKPVVTSAKKAVKVAAKTAIKTVKKAKTKKA